MAFKGSTTKGYNQVRGKQLQPAKTRGQVAHNPNRKPLPRGTTNVVTRATRTGTNPHNTRGNKLNANRVQRAGGNVVGKLRQNSPAAKLVQSSRGQNPLNKKPFMGYNLLANSRNVPAGRGNIRNGGTVQRNDTARIRGVANQGMPKSALKGKGTGFGGFISK